MALFAICVQAAVRADYRILFVSAKHAGGPAGLTLTKEL